MTERDRTAPPISIVGNFRARLLTNWGGNARPPASSQSSYAHPVMLHLSNWAMDFKIVPWIATIGADGVCRHGGCWI